MTKREVPEICTGFSVPAPYGIGQPSHFRIDGYYKAEPLRYQTFTGEHAFLDETFHEMFLESHPDWHYEYKLIPCRKDEATHVHGSGICGAIKAIDDPEVTFDYQYIGWSREHIEEHKKDNEFWVEQYEKDPYSIAPYVIVKGEYHD